MSQKTKETQKRTRNNSTSYMNDKKKAVAVWEEKYFEKILAYYAGYNNTFIAKAIGMDRPNFLRKLRSLKLGTYAKKS